MTDWLPTLFSAAGLDASVLRERGLDGFDLWPSLSLNASSPRSEVLHNIDVVDQYAALTRGDWKYITGAFIVIIAFVTVKVQRGETILYTTRARKKASV